MSKEASKSEEVIDLVGDDNDTSIIINLVGNRDCQKRMEPGVIDLFDGDSPLKKQKTSSCKVVLLVDDREPIEYFNTLTQAGVACERRRLTTFDFLWVSKVDKVDYVLGHGVERKDIHDLVSSLNTKNKSTGLARNIYQRLKMNNSGIERKFYIVQGKIKDMDRKWFSYDHKTKMRAHQNLKAMEEDGYVVLSFDQNDGMPKTVDFLLGHHRLIEGQVEQVQPPGSYMPLTEMTSRADWVTKLGSTRKALSQFGEKRLQMVLKAFSTELKFETEYRRDNAALVDRLVMLNTDARSGISKNMARALCSELFEGSITPCASPTAKKSQSAKKLKSITPETTIATKRTREQSASARKRLFDD